MYDLRGAGPPTGLLTTNDELVFVAGSGGGCSVSTTNWPETLSALDSYRQKIVLEDAGERGCVYLFRRIQGTTPAVPDLISYDATGDGVPSTCVPHADACGAILSTAADVDGDATPDVPAYRIDFRGNWTLDRLRIGGTSLDPSKDLVDIGKVRIFSPAETERAWDQQEPDGQLPGQHNWGCAYFGGYIDGAVRVLRWIQAAMSGATTTKTEFATPGEVLTRIYLRVHKVQGPITPYFDLLQSNLDANPRIFKNGYTSGNGYDIVDGSRAPNLPAPLAQEWYQLSSANGSFLVYHGEEQHYRIGSLAGRYDDTTTTLWPVN